MKAIQKGPLPVGDEMENDLDQIMPLDNSEETNHGTNFEIPKTEENATKLQARRIIWIMIFNSIEIILFAVCIKIQFSWFNIQL